MPAGKPCIEYAPCIAGRAVGDAAPVEHGHADTAPSQGAGYVAAGKARAEHQYMPGNGCRCVVGNVPGCLKRAVFARGGWWRGEVPPQRLAFATETRCLVYRKARLLQRTPDVPGCGEGRKSGALAAQGGNAMHEWLRPHGRVSGGCKAVQVPGVHQPCLSPCQAGKHLPGITEVQVESHASRRKQQAMTTGQSRGVLLQQLGRERGECWPG